ncbi:MAG: porin family protein [Chlorobi bacterium]|nr:porin family protein [Chlorobiota bacterium]
MKKILILFISLFILSQMSFAQKAPKIDISVMGGYFFAGYIYTSAGDLNIKNDAHYGVAMSYNIDRRMGMEISYNYSPTSMSLKTYPGGFTKQLFNVSIHYIQGAALYYAKRGKVQPYGLFSIGAAWISPDSNIYSTEVRMAFGIGGGVKIFFNPHIGLRLQGRLLAPLFYSGGAIFCGTGGCGWGISAGSYLIQGEISAGLVFAF